MCTSCAHSLGGRICITSLDFRHARRRRRWKEMCRASGFVSATLTEGCLGGERNAQRLVFVNPIRSSFFFHFRLNVKRLKGSGPFRSIRSQARHHCLQRGFYAARRRNDSVCRSDVCLGLGTPIIRRCKWNVVMFCAWIIGGCDAFTHRDRVGTRNKWYGVLGVGIKIWIARRANSLPLRREWQIS